MRFLFVAVLCSLFSLVLLNTPAAVASVTAISISQSCQDANNLQITFTWKGQDQRATQLWLDLSAQNNSYAPSTYSSAGPFAATVSSYSWAALPPGTTYYARVNQQLATGAWDPSQTFQVNSNSCGGSSAAPPPVKQAASTSLRTFNDGTWVVGTDISSGTYRAQPSGSCYWERLSGFGGSLNDTIENEFSEGGSQIVTISPSDAGFKSDHCGKWSSDLSAITSSLTAPFGDGEYLVGTDIAPGTWRAAGGSGCYWERLQNFAGSVGSIIANDFSTSSSPIVTISASDAGFHTSGCGTWSKVG